MTESKLPQGRDRQVTGVGGPAHPGTLLSVHVRVVVSPVAHWHREGTGLTLPHAGFHGPSPHTGGGAGTSFRGSPSLWGRLEHPACPSVNHLASLAKAPKRLEALAQPPRQVSGQTMTFAGGDPHPCGQLLTKESIFPVLMAIADSRAPVVEKVQQLPQPPWRGRRGRGVRNWAARDSPQNPSSRPLWSTLTLKLRGRSLLPHCR